MSGPSLALLLVSLRNCSISGKGIEVPISRMPNTPLATNMGNMLSNRSRNTACTCMSQRPGIRYLPAPSTTLVLARALMLLLPPTLEILALVITTVWSRASLPVPVSTTVTWVMQMGGYSEGLGLGCPAASTPGAMHNSVSRTQNCDSLRGPRDLKSERKPLRR
jgi:hypothetical protein